MIRNYSRVRCYRVVSLLLDNMLVIVVDTADVQHRRRVRTEAIGRWNCVDLETRTVLSCVATLSS